MGFRANFLGPRIGKDKQGVAGKGIDNILARIKGDNPYTDASEYLKII